MKCVLHGGLVDIDSHGQRDEDLKIDQIVLGLMSVCRGFTGDEVVWR